MKPKLQGGPARVKRHRFLGFYETLDATRVNPLVSLVAGDGGVDAAQLDASAHRVISSVDDLSLEAKEDQTYLVTQHGITRSDHVYGEDAWLKTKQAPNVARFHALIFGDDPADRDLDVTPELPSNLALTYSTTALEALEAQYRGVGFQTFARQVRPFLGTLPAMLAAKDEIYKAIHQFFSGPLADVNDIKPIMTFTVAVIRDLASSLSISFICDFVRTLTRILGSHFKEVQIVTLIFHTLAQLLYWSRSIIVANLDGFLSAYTQGLLLHPKEYVRQFAGEGLAYVLRSLPLESLQDAMDLIVHKCQTPSEGKGGESVHKMKSQLNHDDESRATDSEEEEEASADVSDEEEVADGGRAQKVVDALSVVAFEVVKNIDDAFILNKAKWFISYFMTSALRESDMTPWSSFLISLTTLQTFIARLKLHVRSWKSSALAAVVDHLIEMTSDAGSLDVQLLVRLFVGLLCERPRLFDFSRGDMTDGDFTLEALADLPTKVLRALEGLLIREDLPVDCKVLALLSLMRGLPRPALDSWLAKSFKRIFDDVQCSPDEAAANRLGLLFERLLAVSSSASFGEGLEIEERQIAAPIFEVARGEPLFPLTVPLVRELIVQKSKSKDSQVQLLCLIPKALVGCANSMTAELIACLKPKEVLKRALTDTEGSRLVARAYRMAGRKKTLKKTISLSEISASENSAEEILAKMEIIANSTSPDNLTELLEEGLSLFFDEQKSISVSLRRWLREGAVDDRELLREVLFVQLLLSQGSTLTDSVASTDHHHRLISYLVSALRLPSLSLRIASLRCLRLLLAVKEVVEEESATKKRRVETTLLEVLFDLCEELVAKPDAFDSANAKVYLIGRIGEEAERLIGKTAGQAQKCGRLIAVSILLTQITSTFTPLWSPAIHALTTLYKRGTDEYIIGMIWAHLAACLTGRLRSGSTGAEAFVLPAPKRKMKTKVDASYFTGGVPYDAVSSSQSEQLLQAWTTTAHLRDCRSVTERDLSQRVNLALFAPTLKPAQCFSNFCNLFASLISALTVGQRISPHSSLEMRSIAQVVAEAVLQIGTCLVDEAGAGKGLPGLALETTILAKLATTVSNRDKGEIMQSLFGCLSALKPLETQKLTLDVKKIFEQAAVVSLTDLLSLPHPPLQEAIVETLANLKIPAHEQLPLLSNFRNLTPSFVEKLKGLCAAGKRFKSKLQDFGDLEKILHPTERELGLDCLIHLSFSHLALKGSRGKGSDRHLIISVLSSLDRPRVSLLLALMLSRLFFNKTLARSQILRILREAFQREGEVLFKWMNETQLTFPGQPALWLDIGRSEDRDVIKRLSGFLSLLKALLTHFRQRLLWAVPFLEKLVSIALCALHAPGHSGSQLTELRRHLTRDLIRAVFLFFDLYPNVDHAQTLSQVYPVLEAQLVKSVTGPSAFGTSASLKFVTDAAKREHTLFVLSSQPKLLEIILKALAQENVLKALREGKAVALVTEAFGVIKALWKFAQPSGRRSLKRLRRVKSKHKNDRDDDSDSTADEEKPATISDGDETAKQLIEASVPHLLRALGEVVMAKRCDGKVLKTSIVSQEIGLLIDLAELPRLQRLEAPTDRELARDVFLLLVSAIPNVTHKDQEKHTAKIRKLCQASMPLVASLSDIVSIRDGSLFFGQETETADLIKASVRRCMALLTIITDAACRQVVSELLVSLLITHHTKANPHDHLAALRSESHPSKLLARGVDLLDSWHPQKCELELRRFSNCVMARWDIFLAHIIHGICCRSPMTFSETAGDPEVQVAILGGLIHLGFIDGLEKTLEIWPSAFLEPMAELVLQIGSTPALDLGVATLVGKFWRALFNRLARLGQVRKFVIDNQVKPYHVTDAAHWQTEMHFAISMARFIPTKITTFATSALSSQSRPLVSNAILLFHLIVSSLAPFAQFLPRVPAGDEAVDFFSQVDAEQSLSGLPWVLEDLLPVVTYSEVEFPSLALGDRSFSLQELWSSASANVRTLLRTDETETVPVDETSLLLNMIQVQREVKITSLKSLKVNLPKFTEFTISKIVVPLAVLETLQRESNSGDQHHGPLSEEALSCLTAALKVSPWADLVIVIQVLARQLPKSKKGGKTAQLSLAKETVVIRAISRLVGCVTYHFDHLKQQIADGDTQAATRLQKNSSSLRRVLIPVLKRLTMPEPIYIRGVAKEQPIRPEAISAMLQAASQLSPAEFETLLPPLIHNLALTLKAKSQQDRKNGRVALRYFVQSLGPKCLPRLLRDLHARLNRGMAVASLNVGVSQLLQNLLPVGKKQNARKFDQEQLQALKESWPLIFTLIVSELNRIANPNDNTMDIQLETKRKLEETRRKKQEPELSRVEGPLIVTCLSAYATAEGLSCDLLPSLMSLLNPTTVMKKSNSMLTSTFSSKYLRRTTDLLRSAFAGLQSNTYIPVLKKIDLLRNFTEVGIGLIFEESRSRETLKDFTDLSFKSLQDLYEQRQQAGDGQKAAATAVMKALGKPTTKARGVDLNNFSDLQKVAQAKRDAHYAVQPGAPTGTAAVRTQRNVYGDAMQGRQLGSLCFKAMEALLPELSAEGDLALASDEALGAFNAASHICISSFVSQEEEWRASSGSCVLRLQRILINAKQKSYKNLLPRLDALSRMLEVNGKAIAEQVLRTFGECPNRPSPIQSRKLLIASGLLKFYIVSNCGVASAAKWLSERPSKNADMKSCIRKALLAHISHTLALPYHTTASQSLKLASLQLLNSLMEYEATSHKYSNEELETLYSISDDLVKMLTQQAGYGMSFGHRGDPRGVQTARMAFVTFMRRFPLKEKAFDAKMNKLFAQLSFQEAEGRRSVMNTIACLLKQLPPSLVRKRILVPLWLTGVKRLPLESRNSAERRMLKSLLMRTLELDHEALPDLLELTCQSFRDNPEALLAATVLLFERMRLSDFRNVSVAQVTKALMWTAGIFSMSNTLSQPLQTIESEVLAGLRLPIVTRGWREIAFSVIDVLASVVEGASASRFLSWL